MSARRDKGSGALFKNAKGLWVGIVELPPGPDGKRKRKQVTSKDKDALKAKMSALRAALDEGLDPYSDQVTVTTWCDHWLRELAPRHVRPNTLQNYRSAVKAYITPTIGSTKLHDVKPHHIREVHEAVLDAGRSTGTALNTHWTMSAAFQSAVEEQMLSRNPCERVRPPKVIRQQRGALSVEQAKRLLSTCMEHDDPMTSRWAAALLLGGRQGELLGLRWSHVDFEAGTLDFEYALDRLPLIHGCNDTCGAKWVSRCPRPVFDVPDWFEYEPLVPPLALVDPKTDRSRRVVPMPAPLQVMLERHRELSPRNEFDLVWATPDGLPVSPARDLAAWRSAVSRAGLPPVVLHEARHTTASLLAALGVDETVRMALMGHSSSEVARKYVHTDQSLARSALGKLSDAILPEVDV